MVITFVCIHCEIIFDYIISVLDKKGMEIRICEYSDLMPVNDCFVA